MSNNTEKKVINGALSLLLSGIIVKVLSLIYKIPLSYILSDEGMGYFNSAYTVYTFFYIICTAGVPKAISILTAQAESEGREDYRELIYSTALKIFTVLGLIITVLFFLLSKPISVIIGNRASMMTMVTIAPSILFVCASGVVRGYFNGILEFLPIAISEIISGVAKLILGIILVNIGNRLGMELPLLSAFTILGITIGSFVGYIYLLIYKKRKKSYINKKQNYKLDLYKNDIVKRIFKIAIPITITSAIGSISNIIDLSVIMHRLKEAGYSEHQSGILYGNYTTLAIPMFNLIGTVITPITSILLPFITKSEHESNKKGISSQISLTVKAVCFFVIPISFIYAFNAYDLLAILFENSSAYMAAPLLKLLAPGIIFMSLVTVFNTVLEGVGKTKIPLISLTAATVFKLIFTFILAGNSIYGIWGAPMGTTVSYIVAFLISFYYITVKMKVKIGMLFPILQTFTASFVSISISRYICSKFEIYGMKGFVVQTAAFVFLYLILLCLFRFYKIQNFIKIGKIYKNTIK